MKKTALFIGLIGSAVLLAGCTKAQTTTNEIVDVQVAEVESEITSVVTEAIEEQTSEAVEQAGTVTSAIESATADFASLMDSFAEGAYVGFADLNGTTVLLQGIETFEDENGNIVADDATCFVIKDGEATMCGELVSGGTAYPISVKDGAFYTGSRVGVVKTTLNDDMVLTDEESDEEAFEEALSVVFNHKEDLQ